MNTCGSDRAWFIGGGLLAALLAVIGALLHAFYGYSVPFSGNAFGSDDAFISYRYAAHLWAGEGLVFNADERVEGYSNLLYVLLVAPGFLLGHDSIYYFSLGLNCLLLIGCCFLLQRLIYRHMGAPLAAVGAALLALSPVLWANTATGLESVLMLCIILVTWSLLDLDEVSFPLLGSVALAAVLCRVDGFILPLLAASCLWLDGRRMLAYRLVAFVILAMVLYTAWRLYYYQDYIANTYHAKVTGGILERVVMGASLLFNNTRYNGVAVYGLLAVLLGLVWRDKCRRHVFPLAYLVYIFSYYVYIGGDIYHERFLLAVIPVGIFFALLFASGLRPRWMMAAFIFVIHSASMVVLFKDERFIYQEKNYDMWQSLGLFLRQANPDFLLAIDAAGKVPYYSKLPTLDVLGLNDRYIAHKKMPEQTFITAHSKHDADYVLSRQPQLIASWIREDLDLAWGMTRTKYINDYEVKYLVNARLESNGYDILDVQDMDLERIQSLIAERYNYGVLARRATTGQLPQASRLPGPPRLAPGMSIHFKNDAALLGWHTAEPEHRWTAGNDARMLFHVHPDASYQGRFTMDFGSLGDQRVSLFLNGQSLGDFHFDAFKSRFDFHFDPQQLNRQGLNTLAFHLPDARAASSADTRVLAIALRNLTLH